MRTPPPEAPLPPSLLLTSLASFLLVRPQVLLLPVYTKKYFISKLSEKGRVIYQFALPEL